ncbi:MAG: S-layer homology domain-containing protein [Oscillospiraceae bacterium]|jgi:hypothetical protein|nr:S-layer homology domain-containing protein [Oscillospiraceae bacterium]
MQTIKLFGKITALLTVTAAALAVAAAVPAGFAAAGTPLPEYVYEDARRELPFSVSFNTLNGIKSGSDAEKIFAEALQSLGADDKSDPYVLDALALLAEECARFGGGKDGGALLKSLSAEADAAGAPLLRALRAGYNIKLDGGVSLSAEDLPTAPKDAELVYLTAPFASLRLTAAYYKDSVVLALYREGEAPGPAGTAVTDGAPSIPNVALRYWAIWVILAAMLAATLAEPLRRRSITRIVLPALCVLAAAANVLTLTLSAPAEPDDYAAEPGEGVCAVIPDGATAILSLPVDAGDAYDFTVTDADGAAIPSKLNPVTGYIDARITASGTYSLELSGVYFTDIKDKDAEMQYAIRILTSRGLMDGGAERSFLPDRAITRAEFLNVVVRVMNLLDGDAECTFPDVVRSDWYYTIAASAQQAGLVSGFDDGSFRGNDAIEKSQMVEIAGNTLARVMGYYPADLSALSVYSDADSMRVWIRENAALATRAGIVPQRADGAFSGGGVMTRGDAAVMLYRLYMKIW